MTNTPQPQRAAAHPLFAVDSDPELIASIARVLGDGVAPIVNDLGLRITGAEPGRVCLDVDVTPWTVHGGDLFCGQAIMACMDTAMVAVMASLAPDGEANFTTVQLATNFERGVPGDVGTVTFDAVATKPGRSLVFGQIDLLLPDGRRAASSTSTCMWLPSTG